MFDTQKHRSLHIVLVGNTAWSIHTYRLGLIRTMLQRGVQVTVIAPHDDTVALLENLGCRYLLLNIAPKGTNPAKDFQTLWQLRRYYIELIPDLIFHYTIKPNIYGSLAAKLTGAPSIAVTTGLGYVFTQKSIAAWIAKQLYSFAFRFPCEVWFLNSDDLKTFRSERLLAHPDIARVLSGEGVDLTHFLATPLPERNHFSFLLVARLLWDKGVKEFVDAARTIRQRYPKARFQLLGPIGVDNPSAISKTDIDKWVGEGLIEYLGQTADVRPYVEAADCIVLPSFYREGVPRSLMEASAMQRPIITTDMPGCRDVVADGSTGFLCRPRDSLSLALTMARILDMSPESRREMGERGRARMSTTFDEKIVVKQYLDTIQKLTGKIIVRDGVVA